MTTSPPRPRRAPEPPDPEQGRIVRVGVKRIFRPGNGDYFLLLGTTVFLVVFGLVMVLSSTAVESFNNDLGFFGRFLSQSLFALIGIPIMLIASSLPTVFWRRWSGVAVVIAMVLQFLVIATPLGVEDGGNKNWIAIGGYTFQPSEFIKVALVVWLGIFLAKREEVTDEWRQFWLPLLIVAGGSIGLVMLGGDLGTVIVLVIIVFGALFFAGVSLRKLVIPAAFTAILGLIAMFASASRRLRIDAWQSGCNTDSDYLGLCWQTLHGWWALAAGGVFGVGLGNSKAKWSWLPAAGNDFIFAIIGEELGLIGALLALGLFVLLAVSILRIARHAALPAARITVSAIFVWLVGQAFINIAVVLGLLPVLGVPLPLISTGGSALVAALIAIGVALSYSRASSAPPPERLVS